jgi:hypothetical protein
MPPSTLSHAMALDVPANWAVAVRRILAGHHLHEP